MRSVRPEIKWLSYDWQNGWGFSLPRPGKFGAHLGPNLEFEEVELHFRFHVISHEEVLRQTIIFTIMRCSN